MTENITHPTRDLFKRTQELLQQDDPSVDRDTLICLSLLTFHHNLDTLELNLGNQEDSALSVASIALLERLEEDCANAVQIWNQIEFLFQLSDES